MVYDSHVAIAPRSEAEAYVCWNIDQRQMEQSQQLGQPREKELTLTLHICDVTNLEMIQNSDWDQNDGSNEEGHTTTQSIVHLVRPIQSYSFTYQTHECYVAIPKLHRDYVAELGYVSNAGDWVMIARSIPLRMYPIPS